jgi:hypothetical protein
LLLPLRYRFLTRQVIETVVDLDGVESAGVLAEPLFLREFLRNRLRSGLFNLMIK